MRRGPAGHGRGRGLADTSPAPSLPPAPGERERGRDGRTPWLLPSLPPPPARGGGGGAGAPPRRRGRRGARRWRAAPFALRRRGPASAGVSASPAGREGGSERRAAGSGLLPPLPPSPRFGSFSPHVKGRSRPPGRAPRLAEEPPLPRSAGGLPSASPARRPSRAAREPCGAPLPRSCPAASGRRLAPRRCPREYSSRGGRGEGGGAAEAPPPPGVPAPPPPVDAPGRSRRARPALSARGGGRVGGWKRDAGRRDDLTPGRGVPCHGGDDTLRGGLGGRGAVATGAASPVAAAARRAGAAGLARLR